MHRSLIQARRSGVPLSTEMQSSSPRPRCRSRSSRRQPRSQSRRSRRSRWMTAGGGSGARSNGGSNCNNVSDSKKQQQQQHKRESATVIISEEVRELDNDYKDTFLRRLQSDMEADGVPTNDLRKRFGLTKDSLETLLPEYKLLLNRQDQNLYRYAQEALTARYLHSIRIDSNVVIESSTSSSAHKLVDVELEPAEVTQSRLAAHGSRWKGVQEHGLHKAGRQKLDSVMELIRTEDRPVVAFPDGQPLSTTSETEDATVTGDQGKGGSD